VGNHRNLILLVAVDLASKALAYLALPMDREISFGSAFQLVLVLNRSGEGSWSGRLLRPAQLAQLPIIAAAYLSLSVAVFVVRRLRPVRRPILTCAVAFIAPLLLGGLLPHGFAGVPRSTGVMFVRIAATSLFAISWWVSTTKTWGSVFLFLAAAGIGNLVSLALPPFAAIDFLYSSLLHASVGYGVFNLADMYYLVGLTLIPIFAVRWLLQQARAVRELDRA
jgi:hypothetical protein